jgi:hypothetical protein
VCEKKKRRMKTFFHGHLHKPGFKTPVRLASRGQCYFFPWMKNIKDNEMLPEDYPRYLYKRGMCVWKSSLRSDRVFNGYHVPVRILRLLRMFGKVTQALIVCTLSSNECIIINHADSIRRGRPFFFFFFKTTGPSSYRVPTWDLKRLCRFYAFSQVLNSKSQTAKPRFPRSNLSAKGWCAKSWVYGWLRQWWDKEACHKKSEIDPS